MSADFLAVANQVSIRRIGSDDTVVRANDDSGFCETVEDLRELDAVCGLRLRLPICYPKAVPNRQREDPSFNAWLYFLYLIDLATASSMVGRFC
jgi:hypothetical protein